MCVFKFNSIFKFSLEYIFCIGMLSSSFFFVFGIGSMNNTSNNHKKTNIKVADLFFLFKLIAGSLCMSLGEPVTLSTFVFLFASNKFNFDLTLFFSTTSSSSFLFVVTACVCWLQIVWLAFKVNFFFLIRILFHFHTEYTFASIECETRLIVIQIVKFGTITRKVCKSGRNLCYVNEKKIVV